MKRWASRVPDERGVALPLALFALVMLSGLVLAFVSMAGMEPQIANNLRDASQARYAAESGIEWAFDQLALVPDWNTVLAGPVVAESNPQAVWLSSPVNTPITLPGLNANFGTYMVQIRNDFLAADSQLTGQIPDAGGATNETNGTLIVTVAGTFNGVTRQVQVVMRRVLLPPIPGAYNMPGVQTDLLFNNSAFSIDGRDYVCQTNCSNPDVSKRTYALNAGQNSLNMRYGLATQTGNQSNLNPATTYEARAEQAFNTSEKQSHIIGKDQTNQGNPAATGLNTVAADASLNPAVMQDFLTKLAQVPGTQVLQSTKACPMVLTGNSSSSSTPATNTPTLTNGCGVNKTVNLGTRQNPALVYFKGELDPTSTFTGLKLKSDIQGAGILVVEDGDLQTVGKLNWDGIVIVTGKYVSSIFDSGSQVTIHGATIANETIPDEGGDQNKGTYFATYYDGAFRANNVTLRNSQEALDIVQRLLCKMSAWHEI